LPYHEAVEERFGIDRAGWKALVEAIYPNAETVDAIVMALSFCRARNLDAGKMIDTVWPGISELRTTAFRTGQYAGMPPGFWSDDRAHLQGHGRARQVQGPGAQPDAAVSRVVPGHDHPRAQWQGAQFRGPKVHWLEAYAK
jgi:hypothetical protein